MPEVTMANAGGENEMIVWHWNVFAIRIIHKHAALLLVHTGDFAHDHSRVFLLPQDSADWRTHLRRREHRRRHLIEKWLKNMMVCPINKNDLGRRFSKSFGRSQTTKTATDDHYPRCLRRLLIRAIDRIEISIVHQSLSQAFEARNLRESQFFWQTAMVRSAANRRPPYQASQRLISRIRISVVTPRYGIATTSILTLRTAGISLSTFGSRSKNRWRLRKM